MAVTVQDFPKSNISIEGDLYSTESPLSTITLQVGPNAVHSRYRFWKFHDIYTSISKTLITLRSSELLIS